MRCNKCNSKVNINEKFCFKCGNKIEKENNSNINIKNDFSNKKDKNTTFKHLGGEISKNSKK